MFRGKLVCVAVAALALLVPTHAHAAPALGHDIADPQCGGPLPTTGSFGIVGVNGGLPYSVNDCLAAQWTWATAQADPAALYINTANPNGSSSFYTYPANDPAICGTDKTTAGCAYNYGWHAAADALARVQGLAGATSATWWLDVETVNTWAGSAVANTADIQGFRDYLITAGITTVGVYSNASAWTTVTGGFTRATASSYRTQWKPFFTPKHPLEDAPLWIAGQGTQSDGEALCTKGFMAGQVLLAQYLDGSYDGDVRCAALDTTPPTVSLTGPTSSYTMGTKVTASFTGADQGGAGLASFDVRYTRYFTDSSPGVTSYPTSWQRTTARSVTLTATPGATYCFWVRSRDGVGNVSPWSARRCTMTPLDDRALTHSSGWHLTAPSAAYLKTVSWSSTNGSSLTRTKLYTKRLVLVATKCPTCGKVRIYLGSSTTPWATVNLKTTTGTYYQQRITLTAPSLATRTVTIRVYGSGYAAPIDGLISSRL